MVPLTAKRAKQVVSAMKTIESPLGPTGMRVAAMKQAKELAHGSGSPSMVYYRPLDDVWFVLPANDPAPEGPTIKVEVRP